MPAPKKLKNPFAAFEQQDTSPSSPQRSGPTSTGAKKLTWSERQALAKKQAEEEQSQSRNASFTPVAAPVAKPEFKSSAPAFGRAAVTHSAPRNFGALGGVAAAGAAVGATAVSSMGGVSAARAALQDAVWGEDEPAASVHEEEHDADSAVVSCYVSNYIAYEY